MEKPAGTPIATLKERRTIQRSLETGALMDARDLKGHAAGDSLTRAERSRGERSENLALLNSCGDGKVSRWDTGALVT